jgi:hypothetical protein
VTENQNPPEPTEEATGRTAERAEEQLVGQPVGEPTGEPAAHPTGEPLAPPTGEPLAQPTAEPVVEPLAQPAGESVAQAGEAGSAEPTRNASEPVPVMPPASAPEPGPSVLPASAPEAGSVGGSVPVREAGPVVSPEPGFGSGPSVLPASDPEAGSVGRSVPVHEAGSVVSLAPGPESGPGVLPASATATGADGAPAPVHEHGSVPPSLPGAEAGSVVPPAPVPEAASATALPPAPEAESATAPLADPLASPPAKKPLRRGRIAAVAGSLLLAGAVVAGVGYTVVTVRDADRDAGAPVWKFAADKGGDKKGEEKAASASGLAGMLVPYGTDGWVRGPDLGEFGSDAQLSGAQATALRRESLRDLPRSQRRQLEKQLNKRPLKGMAMRSYFNADRSGLNEEYAEGVYTVSILLSQMESRTVVRNLATNQSEFLDALDIFRKGPKIKGHENNAKCFLPPKDADEDLDSMYCSAYVGDVLVTATADGVKPLDTKGVAMLLSAQLDRIAEPGKAI